MARQALLAAFIQLQPIYVNETSLRQAKVVGKLYLDETQSTVIKKGSTLPLIGVG